MQVNNKIVSYKPTTRFIACLAIWLMAVIVFFAPAVMGGKIIAPMDIYDCLFRPFSEQPYQNMHNHFVADSISQYLPYKYSIAQSFAEDGYVGWNPYTHNGCAIPENTMVSPGDPFNLFYAIFPFWTAWDLGVILQFFTAGLGMILLLRYCKIPLWGCLLAAISFAFYSQFILWMYHKWVGAMIWAPFLVWALLKYKKHIINVPAILFMALTWRTGHLQACTFAFLLVAGMWIAEIWKKNGQWPTRKAFFNLTLSYFLTGALGALLSLDVFVETLARMEGCKNMPLSIGVNQFITFVTALFPYSLGEPETQDAIKAFRGDLFDIKYGGCIVFILALIGCFNAHAPRHAKVLFIGSILLTCTPLVTYIYSRSTVIMALGMAWLAAWQLYDFTQNAFPSRYLQRIAYVFISIIGLWLIASLTIYFHYDTIATILKNITLKRTALPTARIPWQDMRIDDFLHHSYLWHWKNILFTCSALIGIFCFYKIKANSNKNYPWIIGVIILTFAEMLLFASVWVSYSQKPDGPYIYSERSWLPELKQHVKDGSIHNISPTRDRDFWCNNQFSIFGVRLAYGYETFQPQHLRPLNIKQLDTDDFAQAGISHLLVDTKWEDPHYPHWQLVMNEKDFKLYANPDYKGRYFINGITPIHENWRTCNRIHLTVPPHTHTLTVLESYHKGWNAYIGSQELTITATERGGMNISIPQTTQQTDILLEFRMPYQHWYHSIMLLVAISLLIIFIRQKQTEES